MRTDINTLSITYNFFRRYMLDIHDMHCKYCKYRDGHCTNASPDVCPAWMEFAEELNDENN